ncbi:MULTISPECIES: ATP-binding protein [Sphingomonadaceae]|uniref:ATP-binding protein n=1 Tax=Sphingomonadales TaxID=204457 RepID=UPI00076FFF31|nr:ATP-binding protein [Sphingobium sp. TKS]AMK23266.1 hypothetical protein K426_11650 [Sphingobium sp. TKS]MCF8709054.1 ATP-binding protein [Rhizorhapis sp. SPR117]
MLPSTISARVSQDAITKVTRLFNGTITDVLNEMLQNSRRARSTGIDVDIAQFDGQPTLLISDDGSGIDDPTTILTLGQSDWGADLVRREDPAGMGVFSLAGQRVRIRSFSSSAAQGWQADISADAWLGSVPVAVEPCEITRGTAFLIAMPAAWAQQLDGAIKDAALYYPLPVRFRGRELPRADFLSKAHRVEDWNGCRIGIFRDHEHEPPHPPRINFHGVKVPCHLPTVSEIDAPHKWIAKIDIVDAPTLQLVLPARKEMVENAALDDLRLEIEAAIYRTIALEAQHRLSFASWTRAGELDIILAEAAPWLESWKPTSAEGYRNEIGRHVADEPMIIMPAHEPDIEQCAAQALLQEGLPLGYQPVRAERSLEGYSWYDELPRVTGLSFTINRGDHQFSYDEEHMLPTETLSGRVADIRLIVPIARSGKYDDPIALLGFSLDMLVCRNDGSDLDDAIIFVREGASVKPSSLAWLMELCCFWHNDDSDCDSWDTQHRDFERYARNLANKLLLGEEEALLERIRNAVREEILWLIPKDRKIELSASYNDLSLSFASPA